MSFPPPIKPTVGRDEEEDGPTTTVPKITGMNFSSFYFFYSLQLIVIHFTTFRVAHNVVIWMLQYLCYLQQLIGVCFDGFFSAGKKNRKFIFQNNQKKPILSLNWCDPSP